MIDQIKDALKQLLNASQIPTQGNREISDYASLKDNIIQLELQQELTKLRQMLDSPATFAEEFKKRCLWRAQDTENTIAYSQMPESPTNRLYWQIATLIFAPKTMQEMLAIILPTVKTQLKISLLETIPPGLKHQALLEYLIELPVVLKEADLSELNTVEEDKQTHIKKAKVEPTLENFTHYVIWEDKLVDVTNLEYFMLTHHSMLRDALKEKYPELETKLYTHNPVLHKLAMDIDTLTNTGITPKKALKQLATGLRLGGSAMTGKEFAGKTAQTAYAVFLEYFKELPLTVQNDLKRLVGTYTLEYILNHLLAGNCVEQAATFIEVLLVHNVDSTVLNTLPLMTPNALNKLKSKYTTMKNRVEVDTRKDSFLAVDLPIQLVRQGVKNIRFQTHEDFIDLFTHFQPEYYEMLWDNLPMMNQLDKYQKLAELIKLGYFNAEQKQTLVKVLTRNYSKYQFYNTVYSWALTTNDPLFISAALATYPANQRRAQIDLAIYNYAYKISSGDLDSIRAVIVEVSEHDRHLTLTRIIANSNNHRRYTDAELTESVRGLLELLPKHQRLSALNNLSLHGNKVLNKLSATQDNLKIIFDLLPETDLIGAMRLCDLSSIQQTIDLIGTLPQNLRFEATKIPDGYGNVLLHRLINKPELFRAAFNLLSAEQKVEGLKTVNQSGATVLFVLGSTNPVLFREVLMLLPQEQRAEMLKTIHHTTPIIHLLLAKPELFTTVFELLSEEQIVAVMNAVDHEGNTLIHRSANNPDALNILLNILQEDQRLNAVHSLNINGENVLRLALSNPDSLNILLKLYADDEQCLVQVATTDQQGNTLLHYAVNNLQTLQVLLALYPIEEQFVAINLLNDEGETVLSSAADHIDSLIMLLTLYSEDDRLALIQNVMHHGHTLLDWVARTPMHFKAVLEILPPHQRLAAIKSVKSTNSTVLHSLVAHPETLLAVIDLLPENEVLDAIKLVNSSGNTILKPLMEQHPLTLVAILERVPLNQRRDVMMLSKTLMHGVVDKPQLLQELLDLVPEDQQFEVVDVTDLQGNKVIYYAANTPASLKVILPLYPVDQRLNEITMVNDSGQRMLKNNVLNVESVKVMLSFLPENQRLSLLKTTYHGNYILDEMAMRNGIFSPSEARFEDHDLLVVIRTLDAFSRRADQNQGCIPSKNEAKQLRKILDMQHSFEGIKLQVVEYLKENPRSSLNEVLRAQLRTATGLSVLTQRWGLNELSNEYKTITNYLNKQIKHLPENCEKSRNLKVILEEIQQNPEMDVDALKEQVSKIKEIVKIHRDTGALGFFKCTWARQTHSYNELNKLFDFEHDNQVRVRA